MNQISVIAQDFRKTKSGKLKRVLHCYVGNRLKSLSLPDFVKAVDIMLPEGLPQQPESTLPDTDPLEDDEEELTFGNGRS